MNKPRICLNMIVKNETPVLGRLFASVKDIISYYVIVDTGSTDGTPEFIKTWMNNAGIPGEVHCHEWVNFSHNRNQALDYAYQSKQADWVLLIDADEELAYSNPLFYTKLVPGVSYRMEKHHNSLRYQLSNLVDISQTQWRWQGVVHEYLEYISGSQLTDALMEAWIIYHEGQGVRSRGFTAAQKFLADAKLLEEELSKHPDDARSRFYLAQSYLDSGELEKALNNYLLRAEMPGWVEESFIAQYRAGKLNILLDKPYESILTTLLKAYEMRPSRGAEPLHDLARYCRLKNWHAQAYLFAKTAAEIAYPNDVLFVDQDIYKWRIYDELSIAAYWTGHYQESLAICDKLLREHRFPDTEESRIIANREFAVNKLST